MCVCGLLVDAVYCAGDSEAVILHQSAVMGIELKCHASTVCTLHMVACILTVMSV